MSELDDLYNEAEKLRDEGHIDAAIEKLVELLGRDESHVLSHLALGVLYGRVNRHEDAVKHGQRACELEPNDPFNLRAMSVTYQRAFEGTRNEQYIQMAETAMARAHEMGM